MVNLLSFLSSFHRAFCRASRSLFFPPSLSSRAHEKNANGSNDLVCSGVSRKNHMVSRKNHIVSRKYLVDY